MAINHCRVVLIETHAPGNLGATARIMRNFGLSDLVLVTPIADRNDSVARQMATHGEAILEHARIVDDLSDAIGDCVLTVGTSAKIGGLFRRQNVGEPADVMPSAVAALRQDRAVALVFGPEPTGLSNDVVARCHRLIHIPTSDEYPALNLAQAVAICLYELHKAWPGSSGPTSQVDALATVAAQEHMFAQLRLALEEIHFLYGDKADALMHGLRHLLGKAKLTKTEVKILLGLARQIRWHVTHHPDKIVDDD